MSVAVLIGPEARPEDIGVSRRGGSRDVTYNHAMDDTDVQLVI